LRLESLLEGKDMFSRLPSGLPVRPHHPTNHPVGAPFTFIHPIDPDNRYGQGFT
jgi:hypothetical protein